MIQNLVPFTIVWRQNVTSDLRRSTFLQNLDRIVLKWPKIGWRYWSIDKRADIWTRPSCIYTQIFSPKKTGFSLLKLFFYQKCIMQLISADAIVFSNKKKFNHEKVKKRASKVAHNQPRPFYFTVQPRPQPTAQNWFFIFWNLWDRHLFSYLYIGVKTDELELAVLNLED